MAPRRTATRPARSPTAKSGSAAKSLLHSQAFRIAAVSVGVVGLAALGVALIGPRRLRDEVLLPVNRATVAPLIAAATPPAERAWDEIRPLRERLGHILAALNTEEVRQALAERLTDWLGRFR